MRVRKRNEEIATQLEESFNTQAERTNNRICIRNAAVVSFFKTFYNYDPLFPAYSTEERKDLSEKLTVP